MLVATAGHIDHGKTTLIRALTGVDTDRLPEEKARGISIDLGFAYWRPDDGPVIGFIDVPGHERFVHNMLAGVSGVGFALLVVAADDGLMPQTLEHLRIIDLLGISRGLIAITKCDRANAGRIAEVRAAINALVAGSSLAGAACLDVSAATGAGVDMLARHLIAARDATAPAAPANRGFRLAVDRAFTVSGAGTVVTGTVVAGEVSGGAELMVSPAGKLVRLRGLQSGGETVERAIAGERCALNLTGVERGALHRGCWLVEPALHAPTSRIEARVELLASLAAPLRHGSELHLHMGAADLQARVLIPRQRALQPGETAVVQLVLDQPTSAVIGDRLILRDQSGRVLLGGGRVLDPLKSHKRQALAWRHAAPGAVYHIDPAEALAALADTPGCEPDSRWFAPAFNLREQAVVAMLSASDMVSYAKGRTSFIARTRFDRLCAALVETLGKYHADRPDSGGMTRRDLRKALSEPVSADMLAALLRAVTERGQVLADGALVRLPNHSPNFSAAENALWRDMLVALDDGEPRPIVIADLARELRTSEAAIAAMLYRRRINGDVWQVSETRYMLHDHVAALAAIAAALGDASPRGFSAAQFRDASGLGRNFTIQLLEFFDRIGVTRRTGETRRMRSDYQAVVGGDG
ncbi:MAG: selenocysteine-specific translation elongation factor [Novosphingobium sp.]